MENNLMNDELFNKIKDNLENTLDSAILKKITNINKTEYDEHQVVRVYVNEDIEVLEMADILINIEDFAKKNNHNVVVDFFRC